MQSPQLLFGFVCSYEATSSKKNRSLARELVTGAIASVFLVSQTVHSCPFLAVLHGKLVAHTTSICSGRDLDLCSCCFLLAFMSNFQILYQIG